MRATTNCVLAFDMHDHVLNTAAINYNIASIQWPHEQQCCYLMKEQVHSMTRSSNYTSVESKLPDVDCILFCQHAVVITRQCKLYTKQHIQIIHGSCFETRYMDVDCNLFLITDTVISEIIKSLYLNDLYKSA